PHGSSGHPTLTPRTSSISPGILGGNRSCVFYETSHNLKGTMRHKGLLLGGTEHSTILCLYSRCCFGIWNQSSHAVMPGCWDSDKDDCEDPACKPSPIQAFGATILRCLCSSDFCNANISWFGTPAVPQGDGSQGPGSATSGTIWIAVACPLLLFLGCLAFLGTAASPPLCHPICVWGGYLQVLQEGRFSVVWQGTLHETPVAIKAFPTTCFQHFADEWSVHSLPLMNHDNVARLLAAGRGGVCADQGSLLVLQLYPAGSLRHFLSQHISSWENTVRLALSLARGLAFLHEELWRDGLHKPSVAHRDLSSQNVLVQEDRSCAISDFGLATVLPLHLERWGGGRMEAGTQRYVAPEILDESLELRDWGHALKQADVYSLALVLWEILSRCSVLFPGCGVPAYQLAYEAELGGSPTYEELRRLAVEEQRRPVIPDSWSRTGKLLEDCWDPDPEARLTAECARQRLQRLGAELPAGSHGPPGEAGNTHDALCFGHHPRSAPCTMLGKHSPSLCSCRPSLTGWVCHPQVTPVSFTRMHPTHTLCPPLSPVMGMQITHTPSPPPPRHIRAYTLHPATNGHIAQTHIP
uniref:receptor protein serine/threonine kinase n=1 Tax=Pelusios castaneus TaxID=367368 RepID=A0A8C8VL89_9SAUR